MAYPNTLPRTSAKEWRGVVKFDGSDELNATATQASDGSFSLVFGDMTMTLAATAATNPSAPVAKGFFTLPTQEVLEIAVWHRLTNREGTKLPTPELSLKPTVHPAGFVPKVYGAPGTGEVIRGILFEKKPNQWSGTLTLPVAGDVEVLGVLARGRSDIQINRASGGALFDLKINAFKSKNAKAPDYNGTFQATDGRTYQVACWFNKVRRDGTPSRWPMLQGFSFKPMMDDQDPQETPASVPDASTSSEAPESTNLSDGMDFLGLGTSGIGDALDVATFGSGGSSDDDIPF